MWFVATLSFWNLRRKWPSNLSYVVKIPKVPKMSKAKLRVLTTCSNHHQLSYTFSQTVQRSSAASADSFDCTKPFGGPQLCKAKMTETRFGLLQKSSILSRTHGAWPTKSSCLNKSPRWERQPVAAPGFRWMFWNVGCMELAILCKSGSVTFEVRRGQTWPHSYLTSCSWKDDMLERRKSSQQLFSWCYIIWREGVYAITFLSHGYIQNCYTANNWWWVIWVTHEPCKCIFLQTSL